MVDFIDFGLGGDHESIEAINISVGPVVSLTIFFFLVDDLAATCRLDIVLNVHVIDQVEKHGEVFERDTLTDLRFLLTVFIIILCTDNKVSWDYKRFHITLHLLISNKLPDSLLLFLRVAGKLFRLLEVILHSFSFQIRPGHSSDLSCVKI